MPAQRQENTGKDAVPAGDRQQIEYHMLDAGSQSEIREWRELYETCFSIRFDQEIWDWKWRNNPYVDPARPPICIALLDDRIVGSCSLVPITLMLGDEPVRASSLDNSMVHLEYRHLGIFNTLLQNLMDDAISSGCELVYGFMISPYSARSSLRNGWRQIATYRRARVFPAPGRALAAYFSKADHSPPLKELLLRAGSSSYAAIVSKQPRDGCHAIEKPIGESIGDITTLCQEASPQLVFGGTRSAEFLRWRFSFPGKTYRCYALHDGDRMRAYLIADIQRTENGSSATISDIYAPRNDPTLLAGLMGHVTRLLGDQGFYALSLSLPVHRSNLSSILTLRRGFVWGGEAVAFHARPLAPSMQTDFFWNLDSWSLFRADRSPL